MDLRRISLPKMWAAARTKCGRLHEQTPPKMWAVARTKCGRLHEQTRRCGRLPSQNRMLIPLVSRRGGRFGNVGGCTNKPGISVDRQAGNLGRPPCPALPCSYLSDPHARKGTWSPTLAQCMRHLQPHYGDAFECLMHRAGRGRYFVRRVGIRPTCSVQVGGFAWL